MRARRAAIIGAGMGGLAAAADLARAGYAVEVLERAPGPGGKMRAIDSAGGFIDCGPTVMTMRWVFDALFDDCGESLDRAVTLSPLSTLARHAWADGAGFDLFADKKQSEDAIGAFAGAQEAAGYRAFCADAENAWMALRDAHIAAQRPTPLSLTAAILRQNPIGLAHIRPFETLWRMTARHFRSPRLRQVFARFATYCGSSPFAAPATLALIAHVERLGVWSVAGGMRALAAALADLAARQGARLRYDCEAAEIVLVRGTVSGVRLRSGERIEADVVVFNGDADALAQGLLGDAARRAVATAPARSLSALTWAGCTQAHGFPLARHTVFFSDDYAAEFRALTARPPHAPSIYVCAQDRPCVAATSAPERLFLLVNAPPRALHADEVETCQANAFAHLARCGLTIDPLAMTKTTPRDFETLFPGTSGALYGAPTHGWRATFRRPGARSAIPGLYLAGGSVHPGPGVPMATLSGRLAAQSILTDGVSTRPFRKAAIAGATSTRQAMTALTD
ncbi:MAG: phytoene desaturase family protein [Hyphomonadaceae bacterium]|nr:phytoene desaturase family protein [Hyphomonadaceae bacterium]